MHDRVDTAPLDQPVEKDTVADIADDELRLGSNRPIEAGRQVVEDDDALAATDKLIHHVAADKAGAPGDQNAHDTNPAPRRPLTGRTSGLYGPLNLG